MQDVVVLNSYNELSGTLVLRTGWRMLVPALSCDSQKQIVKVLMLALCEFPFISCAFSMLYTQFPVMD